MSAKKARRLSQKLVIEALHETKGAVYLAANRLSCSHQAIYDWIKKNPAVANVKDYYDGELVDIAESRARLATINGEQWAVKMVLMTKGRNRGWVERTELTGPDGGPISTRDETAGLSDDDLRRKLGALGQAAAFLAESGGEPVSGNTPGPSGADSESEE